MRNNILSFLLIILVSVACAPKLSFSWTAPKYETQRFKKIAIFTASGKKLGTSAAYQENVVALLKDKGFEAVQCFDLYPPTKKEFAEGELDQILKDAGVDAVLTTLVVDKEKSTQYVQGSNYAYPYGYGFGGYYNYRYSPMYSNPGYYQETETYIIENNLFMMGEDIKEEDRLVWVSQSVIKDPTGSISKEYAKLIVESLMKQGIIN